MALSDFKEKHCAGQQMVKETVEVKNDNAQVLVFKGTVKLRLGESDNLISRALSNFESPIHPIF